MSHASLDPAIIEKKVRPPVVIVLGSPAEVTHLVARLPTREITCFQLDLSQAARLREELGQGSLEAKVVTSPDLWDLPADYQTALYPAPQGGERSLKLDMIEQAFHVLRPRGTLIAWSAYEKDSLFPAALKKIFRRVHTPETPEA